MDIVARLRSTGIIGTPTVLLNKAADEIERLRRERDEARAALEKYADPNYNGYNGGPEHARAALEKARLKAGSI